MPPWGARSVAIYFFTWALPRDPSRYRGEETRAEEAYLICPSSHRCIVVGYTHRPRDGPREFWPLVERSAESISRLAVVRQARVTSSTAASPSGCLAGGRALQCVCPCFVPHAP